MEYAFSWYLDRAGCGWRLVRAFSAAAIVAGDCYHL